MRKFDALPVARNCRNLDDSRLIKISQAENRGIRCLSTNDSQCNAGSLCQKFDGLWRPRKRQISTSVPSFSIFLYFIVFETFREETIFRINFILRKFWFRGKVRNNEWKKYKKDSFFFFLLYHSIEHLYKYWKEFQSAKLKYNDLLVFFAYLYIARKH